MFTKNMILLESDFCSEYARITTAVDMMCESFFDNIDDDALVCEATKKSFETVKSAVTTLINKLKEYIQKCASELKSKIIKIRYKKLMTPERIRILNQLKSKSFKGPNVKKQMEILQKYSEFTNKFFQECCTLLEKYKQDPSNEVKEKISKLCESGVKKTDLFFDEIEKAGVETTLTIAEAMEYIKMQDDLEKEYAKLDEIMNKIEDKCKQIVDELADTFTEAVSPGTSNAKSKIGSIKESCTKVINSAHKFVYCHYKISSKILIGLSVFYDLLAAASATASVSALSSAEDGAVKQSVLYGASAVGSAALSLKAANSAVHVKKYGPVVKENERKKKAMQRVSKELNLDY